MRVEQVGQDGRLELRKAAAERKERHVRDSLPSQDVDQRIVGYARGSFTGASQDRAGLFEAANGDTLLLDEIGDVLPATQVKLLRVLQEREVRRVGEDRARAINVRVLAATNRDLLADVHGARFRQDLYYRLRVVEITVPSLRQRRDDILPIARQFLAGAAKRFGKKGPSHSPEAANLLLRCCGRREAPRQGGGKTGHRGRNALPETQASAAMSRRTLTGLL